MLSVGFDIICEMIINGYIYLKLTDLISYSKRKPDSHDINLKLNYILLLMYLSGYADLPDLLKHTNELSYNELQDYENNPLSFTNV